VEPLRRHLDRLKGLFEQDRAAGVGPVWMPDALERKYPAAGKEWGWQWLFPSAKLSIDPRAGVVRRHHVAHTYVQRAVKAAVQRSGIATNVETTMVYTHVVKNLRTPAVSPLDVL
jgi:hypothetical protein